jgi:outer membrane autotransporter protein
MKMVMKEYLLALVCLLLSCTVFAYPSYKKYSHDYKNEIPIVLENPNHFEVIAALGISNVDAGNSYMDVTSSETDRLVQTNGNRWNTWVGQLGVGYVFYFPNKQRFSPNTQWLPSLEPQLNFYYSDNRIEGDIYRFNDPAFNEFSYTSTITTSRLMLDAALTIVSKNAYSLFVIAGIGDAWSKINYHDAVNGTDTCNLSALSSSDRHQSNFVWELGAGIAYAFNDRANLSLEYLYTDFGSLKLPGSIQSSLLTTPIAPSSFNLNTHAVLLGLHVGLS